MSFEPEYSHDLEPHSFPAKRASAATFGRRPIFNMHFTLHDLWLTFCWIVSSYSLWAYKKVGIALDYLNFFGSQIPELDIARISNDIKRRPAQARLKINRTARLQSSNSMRHDAMEKAKSYEVWLGASNSILEVDTDLCTVTCGPGVTMEELVDALLKQGLIPKVVPEFKALTVGGILAGAGLESSSFRHGQFGDSLIEATYILSSGKIVTCSPKHAADLFYGALGACGTLGLLVKAKLSVQKIPSRIVKLTYERTLANTSELLSRLKTLASFTGGNLQYLDAIVFKKETIIVKGYFCEGSVGRVKTFSRGRDPWFFEHCKTCNLEFEYVPIKDYLFRYDAGAFWMGAYAMNPLDDLIPTYHITNPIAQFLIRRFPFGGYNSISRWLLSPVMTTNALYKRLHEAPVSVVADTLLIQDIYIPVYRAEEFMQFIRQNTVKKDQFIEPIWLCPVRATDTKQTFAPHLKNDENLFINFGIWSHQYDWQPGTGGGRHATELLETEAARLGGRKMLYSLSYYDRKQWETIYDTEEYKRLKLKYDTDNAWGDIYHKVSQSG